MWTIISLIFISILFLPNIPVSSSLFIRPEDFFVFLAGAIILFKDFPHLHIPKTPYTWIIITYLFWMILSVVLNNNVMVPSSIFDVVKYLKVVIVFVVIYQFYPIYKDKFHNLINTCFWVLVVVNLFQYFDPLDLNSKIWGLYISQDILKGLLINNRICGLMGNPNINGVLFIIFTAYYLSKFYFYKIDLYKVVIAAIIVVLTQSRTDFIALIMIIPYLAITTSKFNLKSLIKIVLLSTICISFIALLVLVLNSDYISSLWTTPIGQNNSFQIRLVVWKIIFAAILESPIIGHGGNKEFFYSVGINAESQFIFTSFLYGFVGLFIFLLFMFYPFYYYAKNKNEYTFIPAIFSIGIIVTSFTNAPLNEYRLFIIVITFMAISCVENKLLKSKQDNNIVISQYNKTSEINKFTKY